MACIVHGVAKSRTRLSDFHISQMPIKIQFNKSTVTYSCIGMQYATIRGCPDGTSCKEPAYQWGRLERQGLDPWVGKILWRRKWQPAPVFLPGKSHGQRSLAGYRPWACKESDMTEWLNNNYSSLLLLIILLLPWGLSSQEFACNAGAAGDLDSIPGSGRSPGGGHGYPLQYSCLENPMNRGAWQAIVHRVAKSQTWLKQLNTQVPLLQK